MSDLFSNSEREPIYLPLAGADTIYYPNFIAADESEEIFERLLAETAWQQDDIKVFGKVYACLLYTSPSPRDA